MFGSVGDIAYHAIQYKGTCNNTYLPEGITYQELAVPLDLMQDGATAVLVAAANNAGAITRVQIDITLDTDCPGCDLSCKNVDDRGYFRCATFWGLDFTGANLSGASLRVRL